MPDAITKVGTSQGPPPAPSDQGQPIGIAPNLLAMLERIRQSPYFPEQGMEQAAAVQRSMAAPFLQASTPNVVAQMYQKFRGQPNQLKTIGSAAAQAASMVMGPEEILAGEAEREPSALAAIHGRLSGPGAAAVTDPAFVGQHYGKVADFFNSTWDAVNGKVVRLYNNPETRETLTGHYRDHVERLLNEYKTNPHFKQIADAGRHYVHNNSAIVDASREAIGLERLDDHAHAVDPHGNKYIRPLTFLDGSQSIERLMPHKESIELAENLHTAIREAKETEWPLYRGMGFDMYDVADKAKYEKFTSLKPGDEIELPLSSFSTNYGTAYGFLGGGSDWSGVMAFVEGPHKSINVAALNAYSEFERVTQGAFKVTRIEVPQQSEIRDYWLTPGTKYPHLKIYLKQTGVF